MDRRRVVDLVLLAVAVGAVSTAAPLIRAADAPALAVAFWRVALAVPVTGAVVLARGRTEVRHLGREDWRLSALAGLFLAGHFAAWVTSLSLTTVASSVALVTTVPVWAAVVAHLRGEPVPAPVWQGIAVALGGVVLLTGVDLAVSPRALLGDLLALTGGVLAALYMATGARARQRTSTALYTSLCYTAGAAALLALCLGGGQPIAGYAAGTWLALLALMAGPQMLGHTLVNRLLRTLPTTVVSVAILFEIVGATLLAWVAFGEVPPVTAVPAAVLIAVGVVRVVRATGGAPVRPAAAGSPAPSSG